VLQSRTGALLTDSASASLPGTGWDAVTGATAPGTIQLGGTALARYCSIGES